MFARKYPEVNSKLTGTQPVVLEGGLSNLKNPSENLAYDFEKRQAESGQFLTLCTMIIACAESNRSSQQAG